ncbi:MAG: type II secretion system minor pseudopilin GspI [Paracoccaceae bacterium]
MNTSLRNKSDGFTLIESLIALAVLAITAVSFLRATEANVGRVSALELRAAAGWVAQNRLAELMLGLQPTRGHVTMLGRDFTVTVTPTPTADPSLTQVDISANLVDGGVGARLTGFVVQLVGGGS